MKTTTRIAPRRALIVGMDSFQPVAAGALDYTRQTGLVLAMTSAIKPPRELVKRWNVSGILLIKWSENNSRRHWQKSPVPVVATEPELQGTRASTVLLDFEQSGRLAAQHFIERGFQDLAYVWLGSSLALNAQLSGFRTAAEAAGRRFHVLDWPNRPKRYRGWTSLAMRRWLGDRLRSLPKPVGLMVESDWTGQEAVEACLEAGLLVPEQVAVVGCYNDEGVCNGTLVPLSSVDMDRRRQGYEAASLLDRLMRGDKPPSKPILIPPKGVVVRQSSDILAVPHLEVAKALRFIWQNFHNPQVGVGDVVAATAMSKSGLSHAFEIHLNCAIGEQLRRIRVERAKGMLLDRKLKLNAIAAACGFGNAERLCNTWIRFTGKPPGVWRRSQGESGRPPPTPANRPDIIISEQP